MAKMLTWCRRCQLHEDTLEVAADTTMGYAAMYLVERWDFNTEYPRAVIPCADQAGQWDRQYGVALSRPGGGRHYQRPGASDEKGEANG